MEDEDVYWGMMLGAAEMLATASPPRASSTGTPAAVVDAVLDAGIRAIYTPAIFDVPGAGPGSTWAALLRAPARIFDAMAGRRASVRWVSGPTPPTRCRPEGLAAIAAEARGTRCAAADPPVRDRGRMRGGAGALRHERAGAAGLRGCARGPGVGRPRGVARRGEIWRCWPSTMWRSPTARAPTGSWARASPRCERCWTAGSGSDWAPTARPPTTTCTCGTRCGWRRCWPGPWPATRAS